MIIWFGGGLGNQLFQYGLYRNAQLSGFDVKADLSSYKKNKAHNGFELNRIFGIDLNVLQNDINLYRTDIFSRCIRKIGFKEFGVNKDVIKEENANYIDNLLCKDNKDKYLIGYWQTELYFSRIKGNIKTELVFPKLSENSNRFIKDIERFTSVSIHVRRGDYMKVSLYTDLGATNYYEKAIEFFTGKFNNLKFYVFSDDISWCKSNLKIPNNSTFIEGNLGEKSYIDMQTMSMCDHNIIANSSFSWWGAWLNKNPNKIVVAPSTWFTPTYKYSDNTIIPKDWKRVGLGGVI